MANDKGIVYFGGDTVFRLKSYLATKAKKYGFVKINLTEADSKEVITNFLVNLEVVGLVVEKQDVKKFATILISLSGNFKPTAYMITKKSEPEAIEVWKKETGKKTFLSYVGIRQFLMDIRLNS